MKKTIKKKTKPRINIDADFLAIDVETTGTFPKHGCRPFFISTCNSDGEHTSFCFDVEPKTRRVIYSTSDLVKFKKEVYRYKHYVFHNALFDISMLRTLPDYGEEIYALLLDALHSDRVDDTMLSAHAIDSKETKGLKEQALIYCDINADDEKALDDAVKHIRLKAKKLNWMIAHEGLPQLAGQTSKWHKRDMWILRAWAIHHKLPKNHEYWHLCSTYADTDTWRTVALRTAHARILNAEPSLIEPYLQNMRLMPGVLKMQENGVPLSEKWYDIEYNNATKTRAKHHTSMLNIAKKEFSLEDFNPDSGPQLSNLLFKRFKFKSVKLTDSGNDSTDKEVIPKLLQQTHVSPKAIKFVKHLVDYKKTTAAVKYMTSYNKFRIGSWLYPSFNIVGTSTTRLCSYNPNGQNIGKGKEIVDAEGLPIYDENNNPILEYSIRKVFGPDQDHLWAALDYDQLQLRVFAYWSQEPDLIKAFETGFDFHTYMAMRIFETDEPTKLQRRIAKNVNFGYIFGAGPTKIDATAGIPGIFKRVSKLFPNVTESINKTVADVRQYGYVTTASGYRLTVPKNKAYAGVNYIVQGTEGDIVKKAFIDIHNYLVSINHVIKLILQVHDEFDFLFQKKLRYRPHFRMIKQIMEDAGSYYGVVCKCEPELYPDNWSEPHEMSL